MNRTTWCLTGIFLVLAAPCFADPCFADEVVDYNRDIRPLLSNNCFACHGPDADHREGGFRLDLQDSAFGEADSGLRPIVPGDLEASELYQRIQTDDEFLRMPPADLDKELQPEEVELIRRWIEQGAPWREHWSFVPMEQPELPEVDNRAWPQNPIDYFVLARLEKAGLTPSQQADKATLIRRVTFDLTGLPPTPAEVDAFLADTSPQAYERVVDRLLKSPRYGEHMARFWLDAVRYGDTHGLHLDNYREMWPYRDWVVRAFNDNLPYDRFTIEQLAGDLLPEPTLDQQVATGFNRCHVTTNEGGSIAEEVRIRNVIDRVATTGTVFMGLTFDCARCHDHKYDPLSMKDFYSLSAFFNSLDGSPMDGNKAEHPPVVRVPMPEAAQRLEQVRGELAEVERQMTDHKQAAAGGSEFAAWQQQASAEQDGGPKLPPGQIAHYPLDETAGEQVAGTVGQTPQGKVQGTANWQSGKHGGAFDFDGKTHIDLGNVADFERNQPFSYGAWVRPRANAGGAVLARMEDGNGHRGFDLYVTGGRVAVHIIHRWNDNAVKVTTEKALEQDKWQHVFATYDGSSKAAGVQVYFDGQLQPVAVNEDNLRDTIKTGVSLRLGARTPGSPLHGLVDDVRIYDRTLTADEVAVLAGSDPIAPILATAPGERTEEQVAQLLDYYLKQHDGAYQELDARRAALRQSESEAEGQSGTTLVWREKAQPVPAYILQRGEYEQPGEQVERATPAALPPLADDLPKDRLGLAQWLVDPNHPLTARVAVNRFWQQMFGVGIVKTAEDFGSQGEPPSHPELLDWLALQFIEQGWDVKQLMKRIVMSSTYRQSSRVTSELVRRDPANRLLARGPRFRLDAEMLRDQALAVSGLMSQKMGGPSVKPPQPDGLWYAVGYSGSDTVRFVPDQGHDKVHRRTLYTFVKRTAPPPQMSTFDGPSREACSIRRERTNTPMQALLLLNDPQFVEAARGLAERTLGEGGATPQQRAAYMFYLCTARQPDAWELDELLAACNDYQDRYENDLEAAKQLIAVGERPPDDQLDPKQLAAWTLVANLLLNLDEVINKN